MATLSELPAPADMFDQLRVTLNRGLMVHWINADLVNRADCDIRRSIVLWDADKNFVMALSTAITPDIFRARLSDMPKTIDYLSRMSGARYWSVGI